MGWGERQDKRIKEKELPNIKTREQQSVRTKCAGPQPRVTAWRGGGQIPACPQGRGDTCSPHGPALILAASTRDGLSPAVPLRRGPDRCWCTEGKKTKKNHRGLGFWPALSAILQTKGSFWRRKEKGKSWGRPEPTPRVQCRREKNTKQTRGGKEGGGGNKKWHKK